MKKAFMRGVSALNLEAISIFPKNTAPPKALNQSKAVEFSMEVPRQVSTPIQQDSRREKPQVKHFLLVTLRYQTQNKTFLNRRLPLKELHNVLELLLSLGISIPSLLQPLKFRFWQTPKEEQEENDLYMLYDKYFHINGI